MSGEARNEAPELTHEIGFVDAACLALPDTEPLYDDTYLVKPGDETYLNFLEFFSDELKGLPLHDQVGRTVLMRSDARNVIEELAEFVDEQAQALEGGTRWDKELAKKLNGLAEVGRMELFKNIILPEHQQSGIGYSIDLGAVGSDEDRRFSNVRIRRYAIRNGAEGFSGTEDGTLDLSVGNGELYMELAHIPLGNLRHSL